MTFYDAGKWIWNAVRGCMLEIKAHVGVRLLSSSSPSYCDCSFPSFALMVDFRDLLRRGELEAELDLDDCARLYHRTILWRVPYCTIDGTRARSYLIHNFLLVQNFQLVLLLSAKTQVFQL